MCHGHECPAEHPCKFFLVSLNQRLTHVKHISRQRSIEYFRAWEEIFQEIQPTLIAMNIKPTYLPYSHIFFEIKLPRETVFQCSLFEPHCQTLLSYQKRLPI